MRDRTVLRTWPAALAIAAIVAACGSRIGPPATPSAGPSAVAPASPSVTASSTASAEPGSSSLPSAPAGSSNPADQATYAQIETQVQALRQLKPTSTVTPVLLDSAGVASYLTRINEAETNHTALANESRLLIDMGMLPKGSDLEQMELALDSSQVIGFYDPKSKGLYVLSQSGGVGASQKVTFAHEYTHALQDQNFGLDKLQTDAVDQGDRDLARTALPEGDATLSMTQWATKNMTPAELLGIVNDPGSAAQAQQLNDSPAILRQDLTFPYVQGLAFIEQVYANPPASTSQILHPELYTQGVLPVAMTVPALPASLSGWKLTMQDTLGEFQLAIWLGGTSGADSTASAAVDQWAGDRAGLYEGPNGEWAVVLHTAWRTTGGGAAFDTAVHKLLGQMGGASRACSAAADTGYAAAETIALASDASLIPAFATCAA